MKPELQIKFLHYLNQRKQREEGFTLIELLVVIIIIGILAAIALPSLLGQANKAKQSEARNNVGAINRAQQAFNLEGGVFTTSMVNLGIGIKTQSVNYDYPIKGFVQNNKVVAVHNSGLPRSISLKAYVSITATGYSDPNAVAGAKEVTTVSGVCESLSAWDGSTAFSPTVPTSGGNNSTYCTNTANVADFNGAGWKDLGG